MHHFLAAYPSIHQILYTRISNIHVVSFFLLLIFLLLNHLVSSFSFSFSTPLVFTLTPDIFHFQLCFFYTFHLLQICHFTFRSKSYE
ncbi:hypothetical protein Hanom_Chr04g00323691 [Helianthus anomalus]